MSRTCFYNELPKPCQECEYLHCDHVYMEGKATYSCLGGEDVTVHFAFNKGVCCKEHDAQNININGSEKL